MYQANIRDRKKKNHNKHNRQEAYAMPMEGQEFALVTKMLGNGRVQALCVDGMHRVGRIRGSMRYSKHKVLIEVGDLIMVSGRDYEDKVDVIHKYSHDEVNTFVRHTSLPDTIHQAITSTNDGTCKTNDEYVTYGDVDNLDTI